jgi:hypothetical protein
MQLKVIRSVFTDKSTFGKLYLNGEFYGYTCEDIVRHLNGNCANKVQNQTAIDAGTYEVVLSFSDHFKKYLPLLLNVKCFEGIRIHGGNTDADTEGCILVGAEGDMKTKIWNCAGKLVNLIAALKAVEKSEKIFIEVTEHEG